ncbi:MAG: HAMP domain-containing histidine kinase [Actinomycetota bacterium]|nr:HAMP domain-containing histidine kinase [Actinomycetota bacterium]
MFESTRKRLTLGYVGIFALILVVLGVVAVASFARQAATQQDELLEQKAKGDADFVSGPLLHRYQEGSEPGRRSPPPSPNGPFEWATDPNLGMVALVPPGEANGEEGAVLDATASASSFGLPFEGPAQRAAEEGETVRKTVDGPEGEMVRVVSVPVAGREGGVAVIQAAQSRRVVREAVGGLLLILVPIGLGGLLLSGVGGLYMSRRAMKPVRDSFQRQRTFIADASHELKTPLALIKINAEVLERNPTDPENRGVVEDQLAEIDRMDALLSDLLVLARLDAERLEVEDKPFDLAIVAAEAAGRFLKRAAEEGIRLEVEVPDELPVHGDPERTAQILAALLDNAVRYTPEGGAITVSGRLHHGWAEACVTDPGPGISSEHLPRIFDRFYRAEEARTRKGGGTGLGLSIARDLARAQGGELSATSGQKGGSTFTLSLPKHEG